MRRTTVDIALPVLNEEQSLADHVRTLVAELADSVRLRLVAHDRRQREHGHLLGDRPAVAASQPTHPGAASRSARTRRRSQSGLDIKQRRHHGLHGYRPLH